MTGPRGSSKPELGPIPESGPIAPNSGTKDEWEPIEGKPYMFKSRLTGRMKYEPPEPPIWIPDFFIP
jgi:hypothetical protein